MCSENFCKGVLLCVYENCVKRYQNRLELENTSCINLVYLYEIVCTKLVKFRLTLNCFVKKKLFQSLMVKLYFTNYHFSLVCPSNAQ